LGLGVNGFGGVASIRFRMASRQTSASGFLLLGFFAMEKHTMPVKLPTPSKKELGDANALLERRAYHDGRRQR
jgi:hypothetical protein